MLVRSVFISIVFLLFSHSIHAQKNAVNISGKWEGLNYASQVKKLAGVSLELEQNGVDIKGKYRAKTGVAGVGKGKMTGPKTFRIDWVNTTKSCPGEYTNHYIIEDNRIAWLFKGKDCLGDEEGFGSATKQ